MMRFFLDPRTEHNIYQVYSYLKITVGGINYSTTMYCLYALLKCKESDPRAFCRAPYHILVPGVHCDLFTARIVEQDLSGVVHRRMYVATAYCTWYKVGVLSTEDILDTP